MKSLKNKVVAVTFLDHAESSNDPIAFVVYGEVVTESPDKLVIDSWAYADRAERPDEPDGKVHRWVLVRSAVQDIQILR